MTPDGPEVIVGGGGVSPAGYHSIETGLWCGKNYQFANIRGLFKPQHQTPDYFGVGLCFHAGRARWFSLRFATDAKAWLSIEEAITLESENQRLPISLNAVATTLKYMKEYVANWERRPRPKPIVAEHLLGPTALVAGDPFTLWRTARIDDASHYPEAGGKLCIGEAKTTGGSINDCVNQYTLHGQPMLQLCLWEMDPNGAAKYGPAAGVMLDVLAKGYGGKKSSFARVFVPTPQHAMTWFRQEFRRELREIAAIEWDSEPHRRITSCTRMMGKARIECQFRELCMHGKSASGNYVMRDGSSLLKFKPDVERKKMPWE